MSRKHIRIGSKYLLGPKLGAGSFGEIFVVTEPGTSEIFTLKRVRSSPRRTRRPSTPRS
jgi:hypothetical protein